MEQPNELKALFHILEHTAKIAEDAALTDTFSGGEQRCVSQFNNVLKRLSDLRVVPDGLFEELDADASFGQIGIACHQLAAYLNQELDTAPDFKGWFASFFGKRFMENLTEELTDRPLGDLIRKSVPDFLTETTLEDITEVFPVASGGKLTLNTHFGAIDVQSAAQDTVSVRVQRTAQLKADRRAGEILRNFDIQMTHEGADVKIEARFKGKRWRKARERLDVQFDVVVPSHYSLDLKTTGESISAVDITGDVNAQTNGGALDFQNIVGAVNGKAFGGNITLRGCSGEANVKTAGGSIVVENNRSTFARATGGSIRCQLQKAATSPNSLLDLETVGGDINVSIPPDIAATVEAKVLGGTVTTELPVSTEMAGPVRPNQLQGTLNGGGPLLKLRSVGGSISLTAPTREG